MIRAGTVNMISTTSAVRQRCRQKPAYSSQNVSVPFNTVLGGAPEGELVINSKFVFERVTVRFVRFNETPEVSAQLVTFTH